MAGRIWLRTRPSPNRRILKHNIVLCECGQTSPPSSCCRRRGVEPRSNPSTDRGHRTEWPVIVKRLPICLSHSCNLRGLHDHDYRRFRGRRTLLRAREPAMGPLTRFAECLVSEKLDRYQRGHRALARRPALMANLMLLLEHRRLRARVMRTFARKPKLFAGMLSTHLGATSTLQAAANGLDLGWRLLTP